MMEEPAATFESTNINARWLENVYENLKNLEIMERLAREGCTTLLEYLQIPPQQRAVMIADAQHKNLKMMVTEMGLLLTDLTTMLEEDKLKKLRESLEKIRLACARRAFFVKEVYSASRGIVNSRTTDFFDETLSFIAGLRVEIIQMIAPLLYVKKQGPEGGKPWK